MRSLFLVVLIVGASLAASGQTPTFQAPPGYQTKVQAVHKTYNFYGLTRTIALPWERLQLAEKEIPKGNALSMAFQCPSSTGKKLYNNPKGTLPQFGTPARQAFQTFTGKDGSGTILYFEYKNTLPADAKEQLSKLFFGKTSPPDPNESKAVEQFLVNDNTVVVWCFKNVKSKVKETHQEMMFGLISEVATAQQAKSGK